MFVVYLILLIVAILFKLIHWPGASIILLFSLLFPIIDLIVQLVRKKQDKEVRIWSSVSLIFWSVFFVFKFLRWPGDFLLLIPSAVFTVIFLLRLVQKKNKFSFRFVTILLIALFGIFNSFLKGSDFTLVYMLEDPFDKNQPVPHFTKQRLAFEFYQEGEFSKAEKLIDMNIEHLENLMDVESNDFYKQIDEENLKQSRMDKELIQKREWDNLITLFPEDRQE
jgi:signal transduction histidine kinase